MSSSQAAKNLGRRAFLQGGVGAAAGLALASRLDLLTDRAAAAATPARAAGGLTAKPDAGGGYGPLAPVKDQATGLELIMLPKGFEYFTFG